MKKIFWFCALLCSISFPASYAQVVDSCDSIPGSWSGSWSAYGYYCSVYAEGFKDGENVYFNFNISGCSRLVKYFAMTGKCHNGQLLLSNTNAVMTGTITDKQLTMQGNNQYASLSKF